MQDFRNFMYPDLEFVSQMVACSYNQPYIAQCIGVSLIRLQELIEMVRASPYKEVQPYKLYMNRIIPPLQFHQIISRSCYQKLEKVSFEKTLKKNLTLVCILLKKAGLPPNIIKYCIMPKINFS